MRAGVSSRIPHNCQLGEKEETKQTSLQPRSLPLHTRARHHVCVFVLRTRPQLIRVLICERDVIV